MTRARRKIVKRLRFKDEQARRLDSYLEMRKVTFTDFTHYLIESELNRLGWQCTDNVQFEASEENIVAVDLPIRKRRREKFNIIGRPAPDMDPKLLKKLGGIGHNVNQIARSLNIICGYQIDVMQQFSFIDCLDVLADIQQQIHKYLPEIPIYTLSENLAEHRRSKAQGSVAKVELT